MSLDSRWLAGGVVYPARLDPEPAWVLVRRGTPCWYCWPPGRLTADEVPQAVGVVLDERSECQGAHWIPACVRHLQQFSHARMDASGQ